MSSMPVIIPGGKIDPSLTPLTTGVTKELEPHHRRLKEEEERIREESKAKEEKLRKSLRLWDKLERESKAFELKSDLSEKSLKNIAGEGMGGAAF
ncbi:putative serine arginine repetitive matrix protein 1 protein [Phaeoacremonium minimum UCRPA7]|uniref:Putative serine arginine repetitive matrix protein 1 protein n=1 Tax=Phaeoacremonium minimum (strain UCR-PA7) TaxID=1286976 RepID=R8BM19_PHAM7|nr:putative serine arginine repetitive matrix protein 1 protein [Phaeoacremonium minimum UCRPA7]EOO00399.1 putative serine arginine repetitive matrix protein 1 protein [Phaeoacremonium minimum UCRPA7]